MAIHRNSASLPYVNVWLHSNGQGGNYVALIDTGASMSALHPDLIDAFDPQIIGTCDVKQVSEDGSIETRESPTYYLSMLFRDDPNPMGIEVCAATPASNCDMLMGRDFLGKWLIAWDGPENQIVISC